MEHLEQTGHVDISPITDFTPGIEFEGHVRFGAEYDEKVKTMNDACKNSHITFGLKLTLEKEDQVDKAVETLTTLKDTLLMGQEQAKEALTTGASIDFTKEGKLIYVNIHIAGDIAKKHLESMPYWNDLDIGTSNYSAKKDFQVGTGFTPTKMLDAKVDDVIDMVTLFRVKGEGVFKEVHLLIQVLQVLAKKFSFLPEKETGMLCSAMNVLTCMRKLCLEFKYDPTMLRSTAKEIVGISGEGDKAQGFMSGNQEMAKGFIPMAQGMVVPMLTQFASPELAKAINFDHHEFFVMIPKVRFYLNMGFSINGLTGFLHEHILKDM